MYHRNKIHGQVLLPSGIITDKPDPVSPLICTNTPSGDFSLNQALVEELLADDRLARMNKTVIVTD
jgi:hypothetical protein